MPIERPPANPLPSNFVPNGGVPYKVKDGDSWTIIAKRNSLLLEKFIDFNYETNNPDEINWYLRWRCGCKDMTSDKLNWEFSSRAVPGIIYIPTETISFEKGTTITAKKTISPFALEFEGPSSPLDKIGKAFDIFQLVDIGLAIAGVSAGGTIMLGAGIVTAPFGGFVLMGGMHEAALNELRKAQMAEGLSLGMVMAADGRSVAWIKANGFVKYSPVPNIHYPNYSKQLQGLYNSSLAAGIAHGRQFNTVAQRNLFRFIFNQMTSYARSTFAGDATKWSTSTWIDYYRLAAAIMREKIKLN